MRKQGFVLAACAAVVIGCGGGGHHSRGTTTSTTSGSTTTGGMTVNLDPSYGRVEVTYLTGPGRAQGDLYLEITRQTISNGDGADVINRDGIDPIRLPLDGYIAAQARLNVPFTTTTSGRLNSLNFSKLTFDPNQILVEGGDGYLTNAGPLPTNLPVALDARIRAFAGRTATVPLFVSSQSFLTTSGGFVFDTQTFQDLNYSTSGDDPEAQNRVASRLSDFVRFPLTNLSAELRPVVQNRDGSTQTAGYVYLSGDNVALSSPAGGTDSAFQEIGTNFDDVVVGKWAAGTSGGFQGTYDLRENLPSAPDGAPFSEISTYGSFRDYNQVLTGGGSFEVIMFPNSGETYTFEGDSTTGVRGRLGDLVAIVRDSRNRITNIYYGGVDLFGDDPTTVATETGYFELFPVKYLGLDPASVNPGDILKGTISTLIDQNGAATVDGASVRKFNYTFTSNVSGISGFGTSGTAVVFRK